MSAIMHDHLTALLSAGYKVALEPDYVVAPIGQPRYWAHVEKDGRPITAEGSSAAEAIWAASPLHGDDEPMPAIVDLVPELTEGLKDTLGITRETVGEYRADLRTLSGDMADVFDRLDALEGDRRDLSVMIRMTGDLFTRAFPDGLVATRGDGPLPAEGLHTVKTPGVDSHAWNCARCGGQCIGGEPEDSVCRGCGGA